MKSEEKQKLRRLLFYATKPNKSLKNGLWEQASQLALDKKKFRLAVDCLEKVDSDDQTASLRHDQFLDDDITKAALKEKDLESAEYAIAHIESKLRSGLAMLQIVRFHYKNKDTLNVQLALYEVLKKIQATDNEAQKVMGLSDVLNLASVVDKERLLDIAQSIVKTVNSLPSPSDNEKLESESRKKYVNDVEMVVAWNLFPAFQTLAKYDSAFARNVTSNFTEREYRLVSSVAAEIGMFEAENTNKQNENRKVTSKQ